MLERVLQRVQRWVLHAAGVEAGAEAGSGGSVEGTGGTVAGAGR